MLLRMKGKLTLTLALALVGDLSLPITSLGHPLKLSASLVEFDPQGDLENKTENSEN